MIRKIAMVIGAGLMVLGATACSPTEDWVTGKVNESMADNWIGLGCPAGDPSIVFGQWGSWIWQHGNCTDVNGNKWSVSCTSRSDNDFKFDCYGMKKGGGGTYSWTIG